MSRRISKDRTEVGLLHVNRVAEDKFFFFGLYLHLTHPFSREAYTSKPHYAMPKQVYSSKPKASAPYRAVRPVRPAPRMTASAGPPIVVRETIGGSDDAESGEDADLMTIQSGSFMGPWISFSTIPSVAVCAKDSRCTTPVRRSGCTHRTTRRARSAKQKWHQLLSSK